MDEKVKNKTLNDLLEDKITFSEASKILNISREGLDHLINNYDFVPSLECIKRVTKLELESIKEIKSYMSHL